MGVLRHLFMEIRILRRGYLRSCLVALKRRCLSKAGAGLGPILIFVWWGIPQLRNLSYFNRFIKLPHEEYIQVVEDQVQLDSQLTSGEILKRKNLSFKVGP